ncbi:hypothetical protein V1279_001900 [Bradyrhizobium sp. AZCC 1610]|uniref:hypothetical protein n=1 Tax=Bradyrhizobium sp. AZCC 1610 TaxID=3117020 RepID=UPI002FF190ED
MDARDGSFFNGGVGAFVRALTPPLDAPTEQLAREQPACLQTMFLSLCIGTNEAAPP